MDTALEGGSDEGAARERAEIRGVSR